jgi:phage-related protein
MVSTVMSKISGVFSPLTKVISGLLANPYVAKGFAFGKTLGKLFFPITVLMSAWEAIKGMISGFTNTEGNFFEKLVGGLMGAVESLVDFFIAMPLDLIKDLIGWIAGMLGFDGIKESLASFSFSGLFSMIFDKLLGITTYIGNLISAIANGAKEALKAMWPGGETPVEGFNRGYAESMAANAPVADSGGSIDQASMENKYEEMEITKGNSNPSGGGTKIVNSVNTVNQMKKIITPQSTDPTDRVAMVAAGA